MDAIYWACADVLILAVQLPTAPGLPSAPELRQRLVGALDGMVSKGRSAGINDADLAEARYALVAFVDEQILKSNWPGRAEWMSQPLQMQLYREYRAGENFFVRMRALLQRGTASMALEIYYLCLALGFRGAYGVSSEGAALAGYTDSARQLMTRSLPPAAKFGPNALPTDRAAATRSSKALIIALLVACTLIVLGVLATLNWSLGSRLEEALRAMPVSSTAPAATP